MSKRGLARPGERSLGALPAISASDPAAVLRKRMKKARSAVASTKPDDGMLWGSDLGSQKLIDDGDRVEWRTNESVPDEPSNPRSAVRTMPRAQKVWAVDRLSRGADAMITPEGRDAAVRFRDEWFMAEYGARSGRDDTGVKVDPWARLPFSEQRVMCRQSVSMAATKIGPRAMGIVRWCVLEITPGPQHPATAAGYAAYAKGWDIAKVVGALSMTLDTLAVHYGFTRPERATIAPGRKEGDGR